jgi:hypothetical protein
MKMAENKDKSPSEAASVSEKIDALRKTEEGELDHDLLEGVAGGMVALDQDHTDSVHTNTHTETTHGNSAT